MQGYEHGGDIYVHGDGIRLDFSANINPLGMPAKVSEAVAHSACGFDIYPDPHCRRLVAAIAESEEVQAQHLLCGNGAADLIFRLMYAAQPKRVLVCAPTFSEYEKAARASGAEVVYHHLNAADGFRVTEDIMSDIDATNVDMLVLCNPNNPTGVLIDDGLMQRIAKRCTEKSILLLVDECFLGFTGGASIKPLLATHKHILILKAFTKMYAMAGLRLGYLLSGNVDMLARVYASGQSWAVSTPAQVAGLAALSCDGWEQETKRFVQAERQRLSDSLDKLGLTVFDGSANYILFQCDRRLYDELLRRGILIRSCHNYVGLGDGYFRVGLKKSEQNDQLLAAISEVLNG